MSQTQLHARHFSGESDKPSKMAKWSANTVQEYAILSSGMAQNTPQIF